MARRIAFLLVLVLAASLGGSVRARSAPVVAPVVQMVEKPVVKPPVRHRRPQRGTLVASVRPGHVVLLRSAPRGPIVARVGRRTEFGSPQTFAVTRMLPGRRYRVLSTNLPNGRTGWIDAAPGTFTLSHARVSLEVDLSARLLRVHADPDRTLRRHRQAERRRLFPGLRLLHPRPLGPPDAPAERLDGRRPDRDPRRPDRRRRHDRLPARFNGCASLLDALSPAWRASRDPPLVKTR